MSPVTDRLSGRKAQAARNDTTILDAARAVFMRDPAAPISAVAKEAGVGISALYRRYESKEVLVQTLCADGLRRFIEIAETALADASDPWESFADYVRGIVDADVHALTVNLAGTFTPTDELRALAATAGKLGTRVFKRARSARVIRSDFNERDVSMLFEQVTAVQLGDADRTRALRRRYLALLLDGLRPDAVTTALPGTPPTSDELSQRWTPR